MIEAGDKSGRKHFYISYAHADEAWAEWKAARLEEAGYQTIIKAWDFRPGSNLVLEIDYALQQADRTLLVLSPSYLCSDAFAEWAAVFREDPKGRQGQLLPVRVVLCNIKGLLGSIVPIDLVGLDEAGFFRRESGGGIHPSQAFPRPLLRKMGPNSPLYLMYNLLPGLNQSRTC